MEPKKLTRDQTLIKLLHESAEKDARINGLEKEKKNTEKRLKRLEEDFKRLSRLLDENNRNHRVLKEKSSSLENDINTVKHVLRKKQ